MKKNLFFMLLTLQSTLTNCAHNQLRYVRSSSLQDSSMPTSPIPGLCSPRSQDQSLQSPARQHSPRKIDPYPNSLGLKSPIQESLKSDLHTNNGSLTHRTLTPIPHHATIHPDWLPLHIKKQLLTPIILQTGNPPLPITNRALTSELALYICIITRKGLLCPSTQNLKLTPVVLVYDKQNLHKEPTEKVFKNDQAAITWTILYLQRSEPIDCSSCC